MTASPRTSRSGLSVRTRITAAVALLVTLALTSAGLIIYALESARLERAAMAQVDQEIAEFRTLQEDGLDPRTAEPFSSVRELMQVYLERNVPSENELFVAWLDGHAAIVSASDRQDLATSPEFTDLVRDRTTSGGDFEHHTAYGDALITIQPVQDDQGNGALIVVTFLDDGQAELRSLIGTYAIVALLSLGVITALAAWQAGRLLAPLRVMNQTAREISSTDLSLRLQESGNDDITDLSRTFNDMLARLEESFTTQRQFLDAAGHELRTPLTILRGHLEVLETGNPHDVAQTRDLLLDEVDRMSRLVNDLILLTKSGRPDFTHPEPIEVAPLLEAVLAKARGLGVREWSVEAGATDAVVVIDQQRITQALLQLADNAVKHTTPGDAISFGARVTGSEALFWVRDTGHGVAATDRERIFERFSRSTVLPGDEGFGLGLSIVRAIAQAHHGSVHVEDTEPRGATFVLTLPVLTPLPDEGTTAPEDPWPAS
ncbi:ATP-binding protein [Nocardioides sp. AE5]|uniref:sensor histidine kinase n=1 Tax=Nocardioides sp. AE5 TaxID=2962573 RepID=UPI002881C0D2|nr:ATP-binding protein [Nocardioides sp. AE5]MDT0203334.1 ATP-binding protein [Nocardioides sp. AE5]